MTNPSPLEVIYFAALEKQTSAERMAFLNEACAGNDELRGSVERMLAAQAEAGSFLEQPAIAGDATVNHEPLITERPGTVIGPYKLLQQIGEGGMGVVFMAEQTEPIQRTVALKIIKPGMDTRQVIARFEAERQALAIMDHPNIARVLDVGATDAGLPYFVMDLVKGVPITDYCDAQHLPVRARLELMADVCQAVQHAHQKGIIHRDIKPSNVLVAEYDGKPVPKIIDFGVAKATAQRLTEKTMFTELGQMVGTVEYMSPEQSRFNQLDVDTRSDIYSLGVLLYELLAGSTPFGRKRLNEAAFDEMLRIIREEVPPKPSTRLSSLSIGEKAGSHPLPQGEGRGEGALTLATIAANRGLEPLKLNRLVQGELDWIVMKALEKDRNRRYDTANSLAMDIERHLNDEQVLACPPSAAYRFRKFARRNKAVLATTAVVAASLVLGTVVSLWQALRAMESERLATRRLEAETVAHQEADRQRRAARDAQSQEAKQRSRAEANLRKAREAVDQMLTRVGESSLDNEPHMEPVRRELLEDALKFYQGFLDQNSTDPEVRLETARAWERVGDVQHELGQYTQSQKAYQESIAMLEKLVAEFPSEPTYRDALAQSYVGLGFVYSGLGDNRAEVLFRNALTLEDALTTEFPDRPDYLDGLGRTLSALGYSLQYLGRLEEAEKALRQAVEIMVKLARDSPSHRRQLARYYHRLGIVLGEQGKAGKAESAFRDALAICDQLGNDPTQLDRGNRVFLSELNQYFARFLHTVGRTNESEEHYRAALAIRQKLLADFPNYLWFHWELAGIELELGELLAQEDRVSEAEKLYRHALDMMQALAAKGVLPTSRGELWKSQNLLANLLKDMQRTDEAEQVHRQAVALVEKMAADHSGVSDYRRDVAWRYSILGDFLRQTGQPSEAVQAYRQALSVCETLVAEFPQNARYHDQWATIRLQLMDLLKTAGQVDEIENLRRQTIALYERLGNSLAWLHEGRLKDLDAEYRIKLNGLEVGDERSKAENDYQSSLTETIEWALSQVEGMIEVEPSISAHWAARGRLKMRLELWGEAAADFAKAAELAPKEGTHWNALGQAQYRAGDWKAAIAALENSKELRNGGDSFDWFFRAMAHWQLGDKIEARKWYEQAVAWMEMNDPGNEELRRFRAEATELLGIPEPKPESALVQPADHSAKADTPITTSQPTTDD